VPAARQLSEKRRIAAAGTANFPMGFTSLHRHAVPAAYFSGRCLAVVTALAASSIAEAVRIQAAWDVLLPCLTQVPAVSVRDLASCAMSSCMTTDWRSWPDLLGLPRHRSHRARCAGGRDGTVFGPGVGHAAPRACLDHRLDRASQTPTMVSPPAPVRAGDAQPIRRAGDGQRLVCPRCSSKKNRVPVGLWIDGLQAPCRCLACKEPFEHFRRS
jgi:ring-1,2-phenylacetyl-CoA epoxidase subunit PaaD